METVLIVITWLIAGYLGAGFVLAYLSGEFILCYDPGVDRVFSWIIIPLGAFGLIVSLIFCKFGAVHGWTNPFGSMDQ